jgi:methionyl-tRNA formyltransferase
MKIQILIDNNSWIIPYGELLRKEILKMGHICTLVNSHDSVKEGDILFLLGCVKIFKKLELNKNNIVIHESDLPKGKGWSPLTWQVLEGKNKIPICLFEATNKIDAGNIYIKDYIILDGSELFDELKQKQGEKTIQMAINYIKNYKKITGIIQSGSETIYKRRRPKDSKLDINKSIKDQFNLLRVCNNEYYPAFFYLNDKKYIIKIFKQD